MDKRQRQAILDTPEGPRLDELVEKLVFARHACDCQPSFRQIDPDSGVCSACGHMPSSAYSDSPRAALRLRMIVAEWPYQQRIRFCDQLSIVLSARLKACHIEPRLWVLLYTPADIARAAILASSGV